MEFEEVAESISEVELGQRIAQVADLVGGKRALAFKIGLSERINLVEAGLG